jgi:hypothetical protein
MLCRDRVLPDMTAGLRCLHSNTKVTGRKELGAEDRRDSSILSITKRGAEAECGERLTASNDCAVMA